MTVYVAGYKGTDTDDILGVYSDIKKAKEAIHTDYEKTEFSYVPDIKWVDDAYIHIEKTGSWVDEWYIVETELCD